MVAAASAPAAPASQATRSAKATVSPAATAAAKADAKANAKAKAKASTPPHETRVAAQPSADRKSAARTPAPAGRTANAAPSSDPDVALLSAMLATMSRDSRSAGDGSPSAQTQLNITQLVQRCEQRGLKDAIDTFECKRRICDGYWGKADACPKSQAPKKD